MSRYKRNDEQYSDEGQCPHCKLNIYEGTYHVPKEVPSDWIPRCFVYMKKVENG